MMKNADDIAAASTVHRRKSLSPCESSAKPVAGTAIGILWFHEHKRNLK